MQKNSYLLIMLVVILGIIAVIIVNSRSSKRHYFTLNQELTNLEKDVEPKLEKIMEMKNNLKEQIDRLKVNTKSLKDEGKKEIKGQKEQIKEKAHELKEQVKEKQEELKHKAGAKADDTTIKTIERYETLVKELEELETEMQTWKESVASNLKGAKDKVNKEVHDKLMAAKDKFKQLNDRLGKTIENVGKALQQHS